MNLIGVICKNPSANWVQPQRVSEPKHASMVAVYRANTNTIILLVCKAPPLRRVPQLSATNNKYELLYN